jgi:hypothetical protein
MGVYLLKPCPTETDSFLPSFCHVLEPVSMPRTDESRKAIKTTTLF